MLAYLIVPLVILMSCYIAYLGDYLGRKLGKRRLVLFGMRPKHTAIAVTVVTGALIASATLGSIMLIDRDVRQALLLYPVVKADLDATRRDSRLWQSRQRRAQSQAQQAECDLQTSQQNLNAMKSLEGKARQKANTALEHLQAADLKLQQEQKAVLDLETLRGRLQTNNGDLRFRLGTARSNLTKLQKQRHELVVELNDALHRRDEVREQLAEASSSLQKAQGDRDRALNQLRTLNDQARALRTQNSTLGAANLQLQTENGTLISENGSLKDENTNLTKQNAALLQENHDAEIAAARSIYGAANGFAEWYHSTHNKISFEPDQLVAQGVVDATLPKEKLRAAVEEILAQAEKAAAAAGAGDSDDPGHILRVLDPATLDPDQPFQSQEEAEASFLKSLAQQHGPMVVRVQALRRCFVGDQVVAGLYAVANRMIYTRGETIATAQLDGREPERAIRNQVATFLATRLRPAALAAGMLPDTNNQISTDILDKILDLTHQVRLQARPVRVEVLASEDTWCSQPLDLTFRLR